MSETLFDHHDAVLVDLDGTVYRGGELVSGAAGVIEKAHRKGVAVRYVTNNASKPPTAVVEHLDRLGLSAASAEVSTSAQAGAALLVENLPSGARVLVVGADALESEVDNVGLVPVRTFAQRPKAVVQGHSPETGWSDLAEACLAIRAGAMWVACNADTTLPTERGELPGNGAMVAALSAATGQQPLVAGKPQRPLLERAISSARAQRPLMVGDRLDTDIAGAVEMGIPSLMVLTGVNTPADVLYAPVHSRPVYIGSDLTVLDGDPECLRVAEQDAWAVVAEQDTVRLKSTGTQDSDSRGDSYGALRALCAAWWATGSGPVAVRAEDEPSAAAVKMLRLG